MSAPKLTTAQRRVLLYLAASPTWTRLYAADRRVVWSLIGAGLVDWSTNDTLDYFRVNDAGRDRAALEGVK